MSRTGFCYPLAGGEAATGYHPLRPPLIPIFRTALPRGVVGRRQGRYVAFKPFYVKGPAYGGLVGDVGDAARLVMLHLNGGRVGERHPLSAASVAEMQRITPRGGKRDFGLGWFRSSKARKKRPNFVEHLGGGAGFWNVMRLYPDRGIGVAIMSNSTRSYDFEPLFALLADAAWS